MLFPTQSRIRKNRDNPSDEVLFWLIRGIPRVIRDQVEDSCAFLTCGMLAHGCVRVRCERYPFEHLADLPDALWQDRHEMRWFSVI